LPLFSVAGSEGAFELRRLLVEVFLFVLPDFFCCLRRALFFFFPPLALPAPVSNKPPPPASADRQDVPFFPPARRREFFPSTARYEMWREALDWLAPTTASSPILSATGGFSFLLARDTVFASGPFFLSSSKLASPLHNPLSIPFFRFSFGFRNEST